MEEAPEETYAGFGLLQSLIGSETTVADHRHHAALSPAPALSVYFVYALSTVNNIAVNAAQVLLSLYALHLGATPLEVGALAGTFALFPMALAVTAGRLLDRYGGRWPMTFGILKQRHRHAGAGLLFESLGLVRRGRADRHHYDVLQPGDTEPRLRQSSTARCCNFSNYTLTNAAANLVAPLLAGFSIDHASHASSSLYISLLTLIPLCMLIVRGSALPAGTGRVTKAPGGILALLADPVVRRTLITGVSSTPGSTCISGTCRSTPIRSAFPLQPRGSFSR